MTIFQERDCEYFIHLEDASTRRAVTRFGLKNSLTQSSERIFPHKRSQWQPPSEYYAVLPTILVR